MNALIARFRKQIFQVHLAALICMVTASALMYLAAQHGSRIWIWALIGLFILGNIMELSFQ